MAEIVKVDGSDRVVGFIIPDARDAVRVFIGPSDDLPPVGERFLTKAQIHKARFNVELEDDTAMRGKQIRAWGYALNCLENWAEEHRVTYVSFPLEEPGTGKSDHYYGITENDVVISLAKNFIETRRKQYAIACNVKLSRLQKIEERRRLKKDAQSNLRDILRIVKINKKAKKAS